MLLRHLTGFLLITALAHTSFGQEPEPQEPRLTIQIDVSATVPDNEHWIELRTRNFLLAGTSSESEMLKVAADLELIRDTFAQFVPRAGAISSVPTTVIVFRDSTSLRWFYPTDASLPEQHGSYVQPGPDKNYIVLKQDGSIPREVYRDYIRQLIPEGMAPVPLWFREGLADYFSALKVNRYWMSDKRWTRLGTGVDEYDGLLNKKAKLLSFDALFKVREDSPEYENPAKRSLFLAQSWSVVHYLMSRPGGLGAMQRVFNLLADGLTLENAIRQAFGRPANLLEDDYKRYTRESQSEHQWAGTIRLLTKSQSQVTKGECGAMMLTTMVVPYFPQCHWGDLPPEGVSLIPYTFDKTWAEVSVLKSRALSEGEAWLMRGDLMVHIGRYGEADAYLRRATEQLPKSSEAQASLGLAHMQQKRYTEAVDALKLAVTLDPKNYLAHYYTAVLVRIKGDPFDPLYEDLEDIHSELLKVNALAPQFVEAADMLAATNLLRHTGLKESETVLLEAIKRYPGRTTSWILLANVAARGGAPGSARWLLTRILAAGVSDTLSIKTATKLLSAVAPGSAVAPIGTAVASGKLEGAIPVTSTAPRSTPRPANRTTGEKLRGTLTNIECKNGLTLFVKTGGKTVKLHSNSAFSIEFIARDNQDRAVPSGPVVCGALPSDGVNDGVEVTVTYRAARSGEFIGEPLIVEVRVEDFRN